MISLARGCENGGQSTFLIRVFFSCCSQNKTQPNHAIIGHGDVRKRKAKKHHHHQYRHVHRWPPTPNSTRTYHLSFSFVLKLEENYAEIVTIKCTLYSLSGFLCVFHYSFESGKNEAKQKHFELFGAILSFCLIVVFCLQTLMIAIIDHINNKKKKKNGPCIIFYVLKIPKKKSEKS